ncbi:uncharacterized protein M421DRAFT_263671 [Didymella exigua CBS 183.55]|uniref:BZIP domain-containing protein n=1 Tax=Didymella exigua CBS 183.55 TaxID=1150837 RepID=A0A6A5RFI1_9PLEO|nr:uncharacterized protein M421DRAFT_263671 [Didymella exigua CBS 183.55]KAF1925266.1 hypothetical protein M421DRAFT_263671 [Didymella exigua CBS 183.55]
MSKNQVDDAIRIRDNQRRSRARRKDLIKDLQTRVQGYELKGVTATLEMQRAARKVAQENERLRSLLTRHGILRDEIDSFLRSCEQTEGPSEPETPTSSVKSPSISNPYPVHAGPRSLSIQPSSHAYSQDFSPRPSPILPRPPVQVARRPISASSTTAKCGSETHFGSTTKTPTELEVEATIMARSVEACKRVEAYYASPSETDSSPPSRPQEGLSAFTFPERTLAITQSQGCCPPPRPPPEVTMEDPDCPSTTDCFCPPITTAPSSTARPFISTDEISCETAATIIAQMRGDGDEAAARASIGCAPQQVCSIKNAFLMQVLDER